MIPKGVSLIESRDSSALFIYPPTWFFSSTNCTHMKIFIGSMLLFSLLASIPRTIESVAPPIVDIIPQEEVELTIPEKIDLYASKYQVSSEVMNVIVKCESNYKPEAIGDGGKSFGLSQIHLPSWGGKITQEEALDPDFALDFMAKRLSEGKGHLWTCYRNNY